MPPFRTPLTRCLARLLTAAVFAVPAAASAQAAPYAVDPVHTRVMFAVEHAGFSKAIGTVSGSTGELWFDPDDWRSARLRAEIPIARADLGDAKWNQATLANNLLDAADHPVATFVSTRIEPIDATHAAVYGDLTLRGVAREVKLDVVLNAARRHPLPPFRRTVGFSATTMLSRADFGITAWKSVIGDTVELRIEAEATRTRGDANDPDDDPPPAAMPADGATDSANVPEAEPTTDAADPPAPATDTAPSPSTPTDPEPTP